MDIARAFFFLSIIAIAVSNQQGNVTSSLLFLAQFWASRFGLELVNSGNHVTKANEVYESFKDSKDISLKNRDDEALAAEITKDIKNMMDWKKSAVERIMESAEAVSVSAQDEPSEDFVYYNAKCINNDTTTEDPCTNDSLKAELTPNPHFWNMEVNTSFSAVHVPTNVYDQAQDVLKAIEWSEKLNDIFRTNYLQDPSLSWQYFGSSTGFMRQYPAMEWKQNPVDLYDCRTRPWFIEAATSPKDMVILVDNSGSMTGQRKEIARHVVNNILDTLGNNDFVNIMKFSEDTVEIVPCFKEILVQANLANIREYKLKMEIMNTTGIANFSHALNKAFMLLQKYRENASEDNRGAQCNQAIMLITDGVPYNFKEIFEEFNWPNMPVRVFTYLVGREVADVREIKWMACANRGYYVHLSTLAEVREQVLQYIPVMARPLVLNKTNHPVIWTPVYADVDDPKMTDWLWQEREFEEQKKLYLEYRKNKRKIKEDQDKRFITKWRKKGVEKNGVHAYKLMTSISMPVFDRRENAMLPQRPNPEAKEIMVKTRIAYLLGVAGTDVPISEIQKLMNPFKLGVNGYAFIVTNNGYILCHPDLRAVFQGILKPNYNSIDMAEIELVNDGFGHREFNKDLLDLREEIISQARNGSASLSVKYHYDDMRRVGRLNRKYYYSPIENSPFTVVVAVPEDYGKYRVYGEFEIHLWRFKTGVEEFFKGNWKVHPDWSYCKYYNDTYITFATPELELRHFLLRSNQSRWQWKTRPELSPDGPMPHYSNSSAVKPDKLDKDSFFCDRELFQSIIFDAKLTKFFTEENPKETKTRANEEQFKKKFGITVAFVATRSGLTRWKEHDSSAKRDDLSFGDIYNRAIDEIWYKRAVEQYYINKESFVYSVPFDQGISNDTLVTGSRAIFVERKGNKAPAAVVGYQFRQQALWMLFFEISSACPNGGSCEHCALKDLECFVLDNNGYVVVSENLGHTGRFFGEIHRKVMRLLVEERIYHRIRIYDYQAVCFPNIITGNAGSIINVPLQLLIWLGKWILGHLIWMLAEFGLGYADYATVYIPDHLEPCDTGFDPTNGPDDHRTERSIEMDYTINRTRPQSCDQKVDLYLLQSNNENFSKEANGSLRPYVVQPIENTNLILVIVKCPLNDNEDEYEEDITFSTIPEDIVYANESLYCEKILSNDLLRKRPKDCISRHEKEEQIELCGLGNRISHSWYALAASITALQLIPFLL